MKNILSLLMIVVCLSLGVLATWSGATPQSLSHASELVGSGSCHDCSGTGAGTSCKSKFGGDCTSARAFYTCYSETPDTGTCSGTDMDCNQSVVCGTPKNEACK